MPTTAASATAFVRDERTFDFGGSEPMPGHVQHVIDATHDPEVAVGIAACAIASEIHSGMSLQYCF